MDHIEAAIHLPAGARPLASYARYYANDGPNEVVGVYMLPGLDDPPGQQCKDLQVNGSSRNVPCSNAAREGKEVGAGQRTWLNDYHNLPMGDDGKCGALSFVFDAAAQRFKEVSCVGVASNPRPEADQVRFFERPRALAAALHSHTPLPVAVLLEDNPWNAAQSGTTFVLYDDGTAITRSGNGFVSGRLSPDEQHNFISHLNLEALRGLYGGFEVATSTDQPSEHLLFYAGDRPVFISVYGRLSDPLVRTNVPSPIVSAYEAMKALKLPHARKWQPGKFPHEELWTSPNKEVK